MCLYHGIHTACSVFERIMTCAWFAVVYTNRDTVSRWHNILGVLNFGFIFRIMDLFLEWDCCYYISNRGNLIFRTLCVKNELY